VRRILTAQDGIFQTIQVSLPHTANLLMVMPQRGLGVSFGDPVGCSLAGRRPVSDVNVEIAWRSVTEA
jgi:hypothetical protein